MADRMPWADVWKEIVALRPMILQDCELEPNEDGWVTIHCPLHHDESPSLRVNIDEGGTKCMSQGCSVGNLHQLEDIILDTSTKRRRGKRPQDVLGDLAERRNLPVRWLIETFGIDPWARGYCIPIDDPEVDPDIEIDYEIDGLDKRRLHTFQKRGAWLDPKVSTCPKYHWQPSLSKSGRHSDDLVYNLTRLKLPKSKEVYVVAGPPDVWVMHRAGIPAISFVAGEENTPSDVAVSKVREAGIESVAIVYDLDDAGEEGAKDVAITFSENGVQATIKLLPKDMAKGADLTDLWLQCEGDTERFASAVRNLRESESWGAETVPETPALARKLRKLDGLPEECWTEPFDHYRKALRGVTAAADEFHFFSLMTIIGAVLGRRVTVDYGKRLYPNQFTCLTGPTGVSFKSTALYYAFLMLNNGDMGGVDKDLRRTEGSGSAEGLMEAMAFADSTPEEIMQIKASMGWLRGKKKEKEDGDGNGGDEYFDEADLEAKGHRRLIIYQDEFAKLLTKAKSSRTNMIPHLLTAFDCPKEIRLPTRTKPLVIVNPSINILTGTTPEVLGEHFDDMDWYSGFGNRIMFVEGVLKDRIALPVPKDEDEWGKAHDLIYEKCQAIERASAELASGGRNFASIVFEMDDEARVVWETRYNEWQDLRTSYAPDQLAATHRTSDYAFKFAMVYAVLSKDSDQKTIIDQDVELGWKVALFAEQTTVHLVKTLIAEKLARWTQRIIDYIEEHTAGSSRKHGVKKRVMQQSLRSIPSPDLNRLIQSLVDMRVIQEVGRHELRLFTE